MRKALGARLFVRDHHDGHAERLIDFAQQEHDFVAGGAVEVSGRLIRQQDGGPVHQGASQSRALLFAAGKFASDDASAGR